MGSFPAQGEAIGALVTLGYSQTDAAAVVARLDPVAAGGRADQGGAEKAVQKSVSCFK